MATMSDCLQHSAATLNSHQTHHARQNRQLEVASHYSCVVVLFETDPSVYNYYFKHTPLGRNLNLDSVTNEKH